MSFPSCGLSSFNRLLTRPLHARILWAKQRATLHHLRTTGLLPPDHSSHDHLNEQVPVPISADLQAEWRARFAALDGAHDTVFVIADGFLMFYDEESVREFDVRVFVRE